MNKSTNLFGNILIHSMWFDGLFHRSSHRFGGGDTFGGSLCRFWSRSLFGGCFGFCAGALFGRAFFAAFCLITFSGALLVVFWVEAAGFLLATAFLGEAVFALEATFFVDADFLAGAFALVLEADLVAAGLDFLAGEVVDLRGILLGW